MARPKGSLNKRSAKSILIAKQGGMMPMDFLLDVMRDVTNEMPVRLDAAKSVAPYVHPKLAQIEHGNLNNKPFQVMLSATDNTL
jgi:hypothetical protein